MQLFNIIRSVTRAITVSIRSSSVHVRALAIILLCGLLMGAYLFATRESDKTFDTQYAAYAPLASSADNAAYVPGASTNPVRIALDQVLTGVLDQSVTSSKRLELANQGLDILKQSEEQIASISSTTAKVDALVAKMQVDALSGAASSDKTREIITLAKDRSSTISDIRAYSYHTDFEIHQIFDRVVKDHGELTQAYVTELNGEIPTVEAEFDKRSSLYAKLQSTASRIEDVYAGSALPPPTSTSP